GDAGLLVTDDPVRKDLRVGGREDLDTRVDVAHHEVALNDRMVTPARNVDPPQSVLDDREVLDGDIVGSVDLHAGFETDDRSVADRHRVPRARIDADVTGAAVA